MSVKTENIPVKDNAYFYSKFFPYKEEKDEEGNTVKTRAMVYLPDFEGKTKGMFERITYNEEGVPLKWEYPSFENLEVDFENSSEGKLVLKDVKS